MTLGDVSTLFGQPVVPPAEPPQATAPTTPEPQATGTAPPPPDTAALQQQIAALQSKITQLSTPAPAPDAPPAKGPTSEETIKTLAERYGVEPNALAATLELMNTQMGTALQGMGGVYAEDIRTYLEGNKIADITPADVAAIFAEEEVHPLQWGQASREQQQAFLRGAAERAYGRKAMSGGITPEAPPPVPPRTAGPADTLGRGGSGAIDVSSDPIYQERVSATMQTWRVDRAEAERRVRQLPEYRTGGK